jgi:hypothetical protein
LHIDRRHLLRRHAIQALLQQRLHPLRPWRTRKCPAIGSNADRKHWACPADLKWRIWRFRWRVCGAVASPYHTARPL